MKKLINKDGEENFSIPSDFKYSSAPFFVGLIAAYLFPEYNASILSHIGIDNATPLMGGVALLSAFVPFYILYCIWGRKKMTKTDFLFIFIVLFFSGATLLFDDPYYYQIKSTVMAFIYGILILSLNFVFKQNACYFFFGHLFNSSLPKWRMADVFFALSFFLTGVLNVFLIEILSESSWLLVKIFAYPLISIVTFLGVLVYLNKTQEN